MTKTELTDLIEREREGGNLDREEKIQLTKEALTEGNFTNSELAETFGVSKRTVRRYKSEAKQKIASDLEHLSLPGELYSEYKGIIGQVDQLLERTEDPELEAKLIWRRWKIIQDFLDRADRLTGPALGFGNLSEGELERGHKLAVKIGERLEADGSPLAGE